MEHPVTDPSKERPSLYLLTRLAVGGALAGYDGLMKRLSSWELELDQKETSRISDTVIPGDTPVGDGDDGDNENETQADRLRYAAIGMIFDAQETLGKSIEIADWVSRLAGGLLESVVSPIYSSRLISPLRNRIDHLAQRGQSEVDRWIEVGRKEERLGRELASTALSEQVDHSIEYLTSNDEVQELVQSHSVGLIGEIVEETRERTVSADNYLEAWVRTMLRRPMRSELPEPPQGIIERANPYRRIQGKVIKK